MKMPGKERPDENENIDVKRDADSPQFSGQEKPMKMTKMMKMVSLILMALKTFILHGNTGE